MFVLRHTCGCKEFFSVEHEFVAKFADASTFDSVEKAKKAMVDFCLAPGWWDLLRVQYVVKHIDGEFRGELKWTKKRGEAKRFGSPEAARAYSVCAQTGSAKVVRLLKKVS